MEKTMTKTELLNSLFKKYNLIYNGDPESRDNDVFKHRHYTLITRSGIEKIQKAANIVISYVPIFAGENCVILHAKGFLANKPDFVIETFASASRDTSTSAYFAEMAEKRAMSRIVLKLAGLYELGVFGQDEIDEDAQRKYTSTRGGEVGSFGGAVYKGAK